MQYVTQEPTVEVSRLRLWMRRYRRLLPFPLAAVVVIGLEPKAWDAKFLDLVTTGLGAAFCVLGQGLRLWAWGSNAGVERNGVRHRGPYALMRHPLFSGNFLILLGCVVVFNNPWAYPLLLLPFAYLYHVISDVDELQMVRDFGADYEKYRSKKLPRFLPALHNLGTALHTTQPFRWTFAWRKEYRSCFAWLAGIGGLMLYKQALAQGYFDRWFWIILFAVSGCIGVAVTLRTKRINTARRRLQNLQHSDAASARRESTAGPSLR